VRQDIIQDVTAARLPTSGMQCNAARKKFTNTWEENIASILSPTYCISKDSNLHTHQHENLTLSCNNSKFQLTTKAAPVNKFATG
jgi:hypothetical protein